MTLPELFERLLEWREARRRAYAPGSRSGKAMNCYRNAIEELIIALDAYLDEHPGGTDPACECPTCRGSYYNPATNRPCRACHGTGRKETT